MSHNRIILVVGLAVIAWALFARTSFRVRLDLCIRIDDSQSDGSPGLPKGSAMSHNRIILVVGLAVIAWALFASACVNEESARQSAQDARRAIEPVVADLESQQADLTATIEDPETPPEQVAEAEEVLDAVEDQLVIAQRSLDAAIAVEQDPSTDGIISTAIGTVMPFVPEPYRLPVVLGSTLVGSLFRQWKLRQAGREIARGVQVAAESDAAFKKGLQDNAGTIRIHQGATARRIVDEAQGKKPARIL